MTRKTCALAALALSLFAFVFYGTFAYAEEGIAYDAEERLQDPESRILDMNFDLTGWEASGEGAEEQLDFERPLVTAADGSVEDIVASMTLDEKISQLIIPAIRTWDGTDVTSLPAGLAEALRRHQYGGIILFGANMVDAAQTVTLAQALQANNAQTSTTSHIPYLMCSDGEGGLVVRLASGTRMTGSMAIGATGDNAVQNARDTGRVLGEELAAVGVNVDLAPDADVNANPANPVIGTRSFSDDPNLVADLAAAFDEGLGQSGVVGTYKHFPGHGDTGTDTHTSITTVDKTYEELNAVDLVPFRRAVANGAELIMTAHIALPLYDDQVVLGDGSMGFYPATMSRKIITDLLRSDLGYDGVVMTDALEMGAIVSAKLVEGYDPETGLGNTLAYQVNVAEKIINAGVDMLLIPADLNAPSNADFYDAYIDSIAERVRSGAIDEGRINESVTRILRLKQNNGILDMDTSAAPDTDAANAIVGSEEHRATERRIAREAITLVKNEGLTLPLSGHNTKVVIAGRDKGDAPTSVYALQQLKEIGLLPEDAYINDLSRGVSFGSQDSSTTITVGYYYDTSTATLSYSDELKSAIADADAVVCVTKNYGIAAMQPSSPQYQGASQITDDAHAAGAKLVLLSDNLPYDAARYQDSDAIMLAYMAAGLGADPTDPTGQLLAYNANVVAAIEAIFDNMPPTGKLPVNVPTVVEAEDGSVSYGSDVLYERGSSKTYEYQFTEGMGGSHTKSSGSDLVFVNNARCDLLRRVLVDGNQVSESSYEAVPGSTCLTLKSSYLDTLATGEHTLTTVHDYDGREVGPKTSFTINGKDDPGDKGGGSKKHHFSKGMGGSHMTGTSSGLVFLSTVSADKAAGVKVDGALLSSDCYTYQGYTLVLKAAYLNKLSVDTHTLSILYKDGSEEGEIQTTFKITAAIKPKTSQSVASKLASMLPKTGDIISVAPYLAGLGTGFMGVGLRRRKGNHKGAGKRDEH